MARAFDNAVSDRQSLRLEIFQRCFDILSILDRGDQACGIIRGFRNACGDVWPGNECCVAEDRDSTKSHPRAREIVDRLQDGL